MKTPRELILERHRAAEAKLAGIRPEELAGMARTAAGERGNEGVPLASPQPSPVRPLPLRSFHSLSAPSEGGERAGERYGWDRRGEGRGEVRVDSPRRGLAAGFWRESLWPWRRVWLGLAPVWVAIVALQLAAAGAPRTGGKPSASENPQALAALREQRELLAQLLTPTFPAPTPAERPKVPGPRGEQQPEFRTV